MNRRSFIINTTAILAFCTLVKPKKSVIKCELDFENGDKQTVYFDKVKNDLIANRNTMNHHEIAIQTTYDLENIFNVGSISEFPEIKGTTNYQGYDEFHNLIYEGVVKQRRWTTC